MNDPLNEEEIRNALDSIARTYQPSHRARFASLIPFQNQIRELRGQRASFETIAKFLKKFSVQTTRETVRRFYRFAIEQKFSKRKRRHQKAHVKKRNPAAKATTPTKTWSIGQPRVARIEDL